MIIDVCIRDDLEIGVGITIKQVALSLGFTLNSNDVKTILLQVRVVLMHDKAVGVVGFDLEGFKVDFWLCFL